MARGLVGLLIGLVIASSVSAEEPLLERQYLTGSWNGVRPLLSANGFRPYLTYTGSMWSNVAGGRATGVRFNGYLDFGVEIDLSKLGAWDGLGFMPTSTGGRGNARRTRSSAASWQPRSATGRPPPRCAYSISTCARRSTAIASS